MCVPFPHKTHTALNEKYVARAGKVMVCTTLEVYVVMTIIYHKHDEKSGAAMDATAYPVLSPMDKTALKSNLDFSHWPFGLSHYSQTYYHLINIYYLDLSSFSLVPLNHFALPTQTFHCHYYCFTAYLQP